MTDIALSAVGVSFSYDSELILDGVSAQVARGGLVGILGPNGSGKTTFLRLLAGLLSPHQGRVLLDGVDLRSLRRGAVARRLAVVPQETQLAFDYTVLEMALMGRYPHLGALELEGPDDLGIARAALQATGTLHLQSRLFNTLSGGEKQRVVIAGALAQLGPDGGGILLLDEPTASLDLAYQLEIRSLLGSLNHETHLTVVISTHDLNLAASLCRDIVLLRRGQVLTSGSAEAMLDPSLIGELYGVEVDVTTHARTGLRTIIPIARTTGAGRS